MSSGQSVTVETPDTLRAKHLQNLYINIAVEDPIIDDRLEALEVEIIQLQQHSIIDTMQLSTVH